MKLRLNYVLLQRHAGDVSVPVCSGTALMNETVYNEWLQNMVKANPGAIFFLTVEYTTTDVPDEAFRAVVTP